ncbi:MAG: hypothetical protein M8354_05070 [Halalkalicoccus sp.]|nr:hypothetical protein [Halalkalicoccus sp.]
MTVSGVTVLDSVRFDPSKGSPDHTTGTTAHRVGTVLFTGDGLYTESVGIGNYPIL